MVQLKVAVKAACVAGQTSPTPGAGRAKRDAYVEKNWRGVQAYGKWTECNQ